MAEERRVVALTADPALRSAVVRLGALAGAAVDIVGSSEGIRGSWRSADLVVVGADLVVAVAAGEPPRRAGVAVVAAGACDEQLWRATVQLGAVGLFVVPGDERDLIELMTAALEPMAASGLVVAVVGGCGGAGASTLATGLALASAKSAPTVLIDGDRFGGGLDLLLGIEQLPGLRWPELADTRGRLDSAPLVGRLPQTAGCSVLSWDRAGTASLAPDAAASVLDALSRAFPTVVVDLPRSLDPAAAVLAHAADRMVVVTLASIRAVAATAALTADLARHAAGLELVVRDPGGGRLTAAEVERALGVKVRASVRSEPAVATAAERGDGPLVRGRGSLARVCADLLAGLAAAA